ncbi:MAG: deoxyribose-phosphate aldolase [Lachnospiraceae bacterium]|nr:deoxyribose-phosphate aldolase [Lachnospiraceae bacterium]
MKDFSKMTKKDFGKFFDYSVLPKNSTKTDIEKGCKEAIEYNCAAFYPSTNYWLPLTTELLAGSGVLAATTFDFPFGTGSWKLKEFATKEAIELGAESIDMVMNIGALRSGLIDDVKCELKAVIDPIKSAGRPILSKCIIELDFLTDDEIKLASELVAEAGIGYVKTSSGQFGGPTMDQFLIMKNAVAGSGCGTKVAGVKFPRPQNAFAFIMAGADLIGTRAAPEIIDHLDMMREIGLFPKYEE